MQSISVNAQKWISRKLLQTQLIYCGDNLQKLRELPDESVDLIYIDPPFNSNRNYEVFWGDAKEKRAFEDRFGDVEHYIRWMRPRVAELYRVLKKTGSFYYHCDWHADGYVRVMLDQVFGANQFRNAIVWQRTTAHNDAGQYGRIHDTVYFYTKGKKHTWNAQYQPYSERFLTRFKHADPNGRRWYDDNITGAGETKNDYEWQGKKPPAGRHWGYDYATMERFEREGKLFYTRTGMPRLKRYLDEAKGVPLQSIWTDILPVNSQALERIGYPTQKPLPLLNRIISASSNRGDVVLDAFCGCGTTLESAQTLGRRWIGIDISPTACRVMATRLTESCHIQEGIDFWVRDLPKTASELRRYPAFEFENWAVNALNTVISNGHAIANRAKVADLGIDGRIYPIDFAKEKVAGQDLFGEMDRWFPVQVKQQTRETGKVGRPDIDHFETAMRRQGRDKGFFIAFNFSREAYREIDRVWREESVEIIPITVKEILDEQIHLRV